MITFPRTIAEAAAATGELRAGGTDLTHRRQRGLASGDLVDLRECAGLSLLGWKAEGFYTGARVTVARLAADVDCQRGLPGLAAAAGGLATPQLRAVGTVGGNLLQQVRCPYYRAPELVCARKGGAMCLARMGVHTNHVIFERSLCAAPSVSTLAVALSAYDALVLVEGREPLTLDELYANSADHTRISVLEPGEVLVGVVVPRPPAGERAATFRSTHRSRAEWPVVECTARIVSDGVVRSAAVAVGAVARVPLRLPAVEQALVGQEPTDERLAAAAALATEGATPLPQTGWKVRVLAETVRTTLELALGRA